MKNYFSKLKGFDTFTRFRLINSFIIAIGINLIIPILSDLKGEYLVSWVISLFLILETISVKTNRYFVANFSISKLYKISIFAHLSFTLVAALYFWNPLYMVYADMITAIIDVSIFSALSIKLNNYLTDNYPDSMSEFQIIRNNIYADGILLGLSIVTILSYLFGNSIAIIIFIIFNTIFSVYLIKNWNFYYEGEKMC